MGKHAHGLIRAVDTDLAKNPKPVSLFLPFFFLILVFMVGRAWISAAALVLWAVLAAIALPWYAFVGWRAWRLARAAFWQGDRNYDLTGKYRLPPEYAGTESATAARKRRWKQKWRERGKRG